MKNNIYGSKYDRNLTTKDIARLMRSWLKVTYPGCKFSVTSAPNNINISMKELDFDKYARTLSELSEYDYRYVRIEVLNSMIEFEPITLEEKATEYLKTNKEFFSARYREVKEEIETELNTYNFDKSDSMQDYFFVNFYHNVA